MAAAAPIKPVSVDHTALSISDLNAEQAAARTGLAESTAAEVGALEKQLTAIKQAAVKKAAALEAAHAEAHAHRLRIFTLSAKRAFAHGLAEWEKNPNRETTAKLGETVREQNARKLHQVGSPLYRELVDSACDLLIGKAPSAVGRLAHFDSWIPAGRRGLLDAAASALKALLNPHAVGDALNALLEQEKESVRIGTEAGFSSVDRGARLWELQTGGYSPAKEAAFLAELAAERKQEGIDRYTAHIDTIKRARAGDKEAQGELNKSPGLLAAVFSMVNDAVVGPVMGGQIKRGPTVQMSGGA